MILDTCALLWLAAGAEDLSATARERIENAAVVYVSAISAFEIALKYRSGKLILPIPPAGWFHRVIDHHDMAVLPLDPTVCLAAAELPPIHKDPCDRFIIATATVNGFPVVTTDPRFQEYGVEVIGS